MMAVDALLVDDLLLWGVGAERVLATKRIHGALEASAGGFVDAALARAASRD